MEIARIKVQGNGGCNCCKTATLRKDKSGLEYPYNEVNQITFGSYIIRLCDDCTEELSKKLNITGFIQN